jgi:hypothetical protein
MPHLDDVVLLAGMFRALALSGRFHRWQGDAKRRLTRQGIRPSVCPEGNRTTVEE